MDRDVWIRALKQEKLSNRAIASIVGCGAATVSRVLNQPAGDTWDDKTDQDVPIEVDLSELEPAIESSPLQTWLVWPDCHIPFEDKAAFELVLRVARDIRPYGQIIIGDFADQMGVSRHPKTPEQVRWQFLDEVKAVNDRLDQLDSLGSIERHFVTGNHEMFGPKMAMNTNIGLYKTLMPEELYRLKERGWVVHPYHQPLRIGNCYFVHDSDYSGPDAAKQNGNIFQGASTVQGHTHSAQVRYSGNALGEKHVSATVGWLGDYKAAEYMCEIKKRVNWMHAFGLMYVEPNGNFHFQLVPLVDYRAVVNGRLYT